MFIKNYNIVLQYYRKLLNEINTSGDDSIIYHFLEEIGDDKKSIYKFT